MESLEQGLDVNVVTLKALCDQVDAADRERAVEALRCCDTRLCVQMRTHE